MRVLLTTILLATGAAQAQVTPPAPAPMADNKAGNLAGNLAPDFYPKSTCIKPGPPPKRPSNNDGVGDAVMTYNVRVKSYNAKNVAFHDCIKAYVDGAQNDISHIQDIVHAAVADANAH